MLVDQPPYYNLLGDLQFQPILNVVSNKMISLYRDGHSSSVGSASEFTTDQINLFLEFNPFNIDEPVVTVEKVQSLSFRLQIILSLCGAFRGGDCVILMRSQFERRISAEGQHYYELKFYAEKNNNGDLYTKAPIPRIIRVPNSLDTLSLIDLFLGKMEGIKTQNFFLSINNSTGINNGAWFKNLPMGRNKISQRLKSACQTLNFPQKNLTNHSFRVTSVNVMQDANVPLSDIRTVTGYKSTDGLESFIRSNESRKAAATEALASVFKSGESSVLREKRKVINTIHSDGSCSFEEEVTSQIVSTRKHQLQIPLKKLEYGTEFEKRKLDILSKLYENENSEPMKKKILRSIDKM